MSIVSAAPRLRDALGVKARAALHRILVEERGGRLDDLYPRFSRQDTLDTLPPRNAHCRLLLIGYPKGLHELYRTLVVHGCVPAAADEITLWIAASYRRLKHDATLDERVYPPLLVTYAMRSTTATKKHHKSPPRVPR